MSKFILTILISLVLFGCTPVNENSYVKPMSDLSHDAKTILKILDNNLQLFEVYPNDKVQSRTIQLWIKGGDEWIKGGAISGNLDNDSPNPQVYALLLNDNEISITSLNDNSKYNLILPEMDFDEYNARSKYLISNKIELELDKEYVLALKYASNSDAIRDYDENCDFREIETPLAYAVTICLHSTAQELE